MAADNGQTAEKKKPQTRPYSVLKGVSVNLGGNPADVVSALVEAFGDEEIELTGPIGRAVQTNPIRALETVAELKDLDGTYKIIADSAVTEKTVAVETKKSVSIS